MHTITMSNYEEALEAIRDILLMYVDMAKGYEGFGHNADAGIRFDPLRFIDAETDQKAHYVDLNLLHAGCAIAILFEYYNRWGEEQGLAGNTYLAKYQAALSEGRLGLFSDIEEVIRAAVARDPMPLEDSWFEEAVVPIYRKYVVGFFARLAASDRHRT
ncbi:MAG: hypothetical protein EON91_12730 [Brevundimonas sp.]|uniref:hypothetical protein n=1 Tax=Brevundimonas sp. TaxID=1871086 RepID=UPI0012251761|nr:hypothetical protein [Brevundimonas sp.]RZJ16555.1 MAG: hypothetical protein EON91_12730 [Brevundimonas sp.]